MAARTLGSGRLKLPNTARTAAILEVYALRLAGDFLAPKIIRRVEYFMFLNQAVGWGGCAIAGDVGVRHSW